MLIDSVIEGWGRGQCSVSMSSTLGLILTSAVVSAVVLERHAIANAEAALE